VFYLLIVPHALLFFAHVLKKKLYRIVSTLRNKQRSGVD